MRTPWHLGTADLSRGQQSEELEGAPSPQGLDLKQEQRKRAESPRRGLAHAYFRRVT